MKFDDINPAFTSFNFAYKRLINWKSQWREEKKIASGILRTNRMYRRWVPIMQWSKVSKIILISIKLLDYFNASPSFLRRISLSTSAMKSTNEIFNTWQIWWSSMISSRRSQVSTLLINAWLTFRSSASWACVTPPPIHACYASDQSLGDINVNVWSCPFSFYF